MIDLDEFVARPSMEPEMLARAVHSVLRREPATASRPAGDVERAIREVIEAGAGLRPGSPASIQVREALNATLLRLAGASLPAIAAEMARRVDEPAQRLLTDALMMRYRTQAPAAAPPPAASLPSPRDEYDEAQLPDIDRRAAPGTRPGRPRADDSIAGPLEQVRRYANELRDATNPPVAASSSGDVVHRFALADGVQLLIEEASWNAIVREGRQVQVLRALREALLAGRSDGPR